MSPTLYFKLLSAETKAGFSDDELPMEALEDQKPEIITNADGNKELVFDGVSVGLPPGAEWSIGQHVSGDYFVGAPNFKPKWVKTLINRKKQKLEDGKTREKSEEPPEKLVISFIDGVKNCQNKRNFECRTSGTLQKSPFSQT